MLDGAASPRELPAWPFYLLFVGYPLWWLAGLGAFAPALVALPMTVLLVTRGQVRVPRIFALWALFVLCALTAAVMLDGLPRLVGFGVRMSSYAGATILFLYVYNVSRKRLPSASAVLVMTAFFAFVVLGGWLGVIFPGVRLSTPVEAVLPGALLDNEYVRALVSPALAEVQQPYGSPRSFTRPSAPFAYTNGWGCNVALLVPFVLAALAQARSTRRRVLLALLLAAAVVPAAATLNRGMFLAVAAGLAYGALRYARRGHPAALVTLVAIGGVGAIVATASGLVARLTERLYYSQTNLGRSTIYQEAFDGALESPLLGHGAPRPSALLDISIGTQGQVWNVMFSYGFPALVFFVGWFAAAAWTSRKVTGPGLLWLHAVLVVTLLTLFYYGYDGPQLCVAMVAAALVLRPPEPTDPATHQERADDVLLQSREAART